MQESQENSFSKDNQRQLDSTFINQAYSRTLHNEQQSNQPEQSSTFQTLDQIQRKMKQVQTQLINIQQQKSNRNLSNEEYLQLQDQRTKLKRYLIDLDHEHKQCCQRIRKDAEELARKKWEDVYRKMEDQERQIQRLRQQERLERNRLLDEKLKEIEQSSIKRREQIEQMYNKTPPSIKPEPNKSRQNQQSEQINQQEIEKNILYRNRNAGQGKTQSDRQEEELYRAKVDSIQRQLASQSLRRSRQTELEGQLLRLNTLSAHYREPYYPLYYSSLSYTPYDPLYQGIYSTYPYI